MTNLEERLNDLADKYTDNNRPRETSEYSGEGVYRFKDIEEAYKAGARAVLEMPELKALLCSLENIKISNISSDHDWIIADEAITQWISFIGEVNNEKSK